MNKLHILRWEVEPQQMGASEITMKPNTRLEHSHAHRPDLHHQHEH